LKPNDSSFDGKGSGWPLSGPISCIQELTCNDSS
jgi:hypothetical protein